MDQIPSAHLNRLAVEMKGVEIFRCNIKNLLFNMDCKDDPLCQKIILAAKEAAERLLSEENVQRFQSPKPGLSPYTTLNKRTRMYLTSDPDLLYNINKFSVDEEGSTRTEED